MTNRQTYVAILQEALGIPEEQIPDAQYGVTPSWDSVAQVAIVFAAESAFGVSFAPADVMDFSSYDKGEAVLRKLGIALEDRASPRDPERAP